MVWRDLGLNPDLPDHWQILYPLDQCPGLDVPGKYLAIWCDYVIYGNKILQNHLTKLLVDEIDLVRECIYKNDRSWFHIQVHFISAFHELKHRGIMSHTVRSGQKIWNEEFLSLIQPLFILHQNTVRSAIKHRRERVFTTTTTDNWSVYKNKSTNFIIYLIKLNIFFFFLNKLVEKIPTTNLFILHLMTGQIFNILYFFLWGKKVKKNKKNKSGTGLVISFSKLSEINNNLVFEPWNTRNTPENK